jgi:large subunit ribosomal protein L4
VIEDAKAKEAKTGDLAKRFGKMSIGNALVVDGEFDKNFHLSARNISHLSLLPASGLNVYDIMRSEKLILTKAALAAIEERFA